VRQRLKEARVVRPESSVQLLGPEPSAVQAIGAAEPPAPPKVGWSALKTGSHAAQVLILVLALAAYLVAVRPFYTKELLQARAGEIAAELRELDVRRRATDDALAKASSQLARLEQRRRETEELLKTKREELSKALLVQARTGMQASQRYETLFASILSDVTRTFRSCNLSGDPVLDSEDALKSRSLDVCLKGALQTLEARSKLLSKKDAEVISTQLQSSFDRYLPAYQATVASYFFERRRYATRTDRPNWTPEMVAEEERQIYRVANLAAAQIRRLIEQIEQDVKREVGAIRSGRGK
jgi:F0F1-type ATP synthase membrane subunit b/b'